MGKFHACAYFQLAACATQTILTYLVCARSPDERTEAHLEHHDHDVDTHSAIAPPKIAPTLTAGGTVVAASFAIVSAGVSVFIYTCEWNTFALYFREVYGWGSMWTGLAQSVGDLIAAVWLIVTSTYKLKVPKIVGNRIVHVAVVFGSYTIFFLMLASSTFAVAVAGQVAMGLSYVLSVELSSKMVLVYGRGDNTLYRRLIFAQEVAFTAGVALSSGALVAYDIDKTLPFYLCSMISLFWGSMYVLYLCLRFPRASICSGSFAENEEILFHSRCSYTRFGHQG